MLTTTEETLKEVFQKAAGGRENTIERVKKIRDYAFIHFRSREDAVKAMNIINGKRCVRVLICVSEKGGGGWRYDGSPCLIINLCSRSRLCTPLTLSTCTDFCL